MSSTRLVHQREEMDCGIACIAMATGHPYEDVQEAAKGFYDPEQGINDELSILSKLGYCIRSGRSSHDGSICSVTRMDSWRPRDYRMIAWGRRAIMLVPSLNFSDRFHFVYWDGSQVLDPTLKSQRYTRWEQLEPERMVLFQESIGGKLCR